MSAEANRKRVIVLTPTPNESASFATLLARRAVAKIVALIADAVENTAATRTATKPARPGGMRRRPDRR